MQHFDLAMEHGQVEEVERQMGLWYNILTLGVFESTSVILSAKLGF